MSKYVPMGFKQYYKLGCTKVLKLKRTLYSLCQSPHAFWKFVTEKLVKCGMEQSDLDPCLFISEKVICVVYGDDFLFWSTDKKYIYNLAEALRKEDVLLEEEGNAARFLGVKLTQLIDRHISMTQCGLINQIITALGLDGNGVKMKSTPADQKPLIKDANGVGMLAYLAGHSRPDISYAVNCAAGYTFCPR